MASTASSKNKTHQDSTNPEQNLDQYLELIHSIINERKANPYQNYSLKNSDAGATILKLSQPQQASFALLLLSWYQQQVASYANSKRYDHTVVQSARHGFETLLQLINRKLPFEEHEVLRWLEVIRSEDRVWWRGHRQITKIVTHYLKDHPLTPELETSIQLTCDHLNRHYRDARKYATQLKALISDPEEKLAIHPGEAWSDAAIAHISALDDTTRQSWIQLIEQCSLVSGGKPSKQWHNATQTRLQTIGQTTFNTTVLAWFPLVDQPRTQPLAGWRGGTDAIQDQNGDILKGLVWLCAKQTDPNLVRALSKLAVSAYRKLPGIGPRCIKLGNACVWALGQMPTQDAIAQLALLKVKVKFGTAQKGIDKALTAAAEREGMPREEIEELAVPTYGLTDVGLRQETLGEFTAELVVTGTSRTTLRWIKPDGKPQKSVPKAVKDNHAEELKELKQAAKEIQKMLPAQRDRIESLYLQQTTWDFATWQERYLNHPLMGTLARRMLWQFEQGENCKTESSHAVGIWFEGQLVDIEGKAIAGLTPTTQVTLWHPITATATTIQTWRNWLLEHQIQQPFKQAHRELYLLTPAEETTGVYSNRFAAHILKQHQFNALCGQRGWKNSLRLMVDDCYPPATRPLPQWELRAEFWIEGIGDQYGEDTTDTGTYLHISTDQVRFYPIDAPQNVAHASGGGYGGNDYRQALAAPLALSEIPALVLSEILRDVDLFVGVASVGNDPNWVDGGPEARRPEGYNYWYDYSFGELSATAQTRRQVLETLVPKLKKIRDRVTFQDRFLVVKGDLRTYKIHLGSSNIIMEPNNQYLCIVKGGSSSAENVFLPFEGDKVLATILSKAFLLAEDTKITDPTILSQIKR